MLMTEMLETVFVGDKFDNELFLQQKCHQYIKKGGENNDFAINILKLSLS